MGYWQVVLLEPAKTVVSQITRFLINIFLVIIILLIGWLIAKFIKSVVAKLLKSLRFDELSERIELDNLLAKGGIAYSLSDLIGIICYWLAILVTLVVALHAIGLTFAPRMLEGIVAYVPNIIAAIFILILGMFVAKVLSNIFKTAASNAGIPQATLLSKIVEVIVVIFAIAITLRQLNIGAKIIELTVSIILGSLGLGFALAFGLGCKDIVGKFVADLISKLKK